MNVTVTTRLGSLSEQNGFTLFPRFGVLLVFFPEIGVKLMEPQVLSSSGAGVSAAIALGA